MPELPEVESVCGMLRSEVRGATVANVSFLRLRPQNEASARKISHIFHPFSEDLSRWGDYGWSEAGYVRTYLQAMRHAFAALAGMCLAEIERRGKYILLTFIESSEQKNQNATEKKCVLVLHLRMAGQLLVCHERKKGLRHDHMVLELRHSRSATRCFLVYRDTRFGHVLPMISEKSWLFVHTLADKRRHRIFDTLRVWLEERLSRLGLEPLAATGPGAIIKRIHVCKGERRYAKSACHHFLLDSRAIVGIGNIYASEILHRSKLHPLKKLEILSLREEKRLAEAIHAILIGAVKCLGTSLDTQKKEGRQPGRGGGHFRLPDGNAGTYACKLCAYGREHQGCLRQNCGGLIKRIVFHGRSLYFCQRCQKY